METDRYVRVLADGQTVFHVMGTVTQGGKERVFGRSEVHYAGDEFPASELPEHLLEPLLDGEETSETFALVDPPEPDDEEPVDELEESADTPGTGAAPGTGGTPQGSEGTSPSSDDGADGPHVNPNADPEVSVNESPVEVPGTGEGSPGETPVEPGSGQTEPVVESEQGDAAVVEQTVEGETPDEGVQAPQYDPSEHNQDDVLAYLATASADEVQRVKDAEAAGKDRNQIRDFKVAD